MENQESLYAISQCIGWCKAVYKILSPEPLSKARYRKWFKVVSKYYVDKINNTSTNESLYNVLVWQTARKLDTTVERVESIFEETPHDGYHVLGADKLTNVVPSVISNKLIQMRGNEEFIRLVLRYYMMCVSEGLFLSIDREYYKLISRSSKLPILEGYASPLNHNLSEYCSLFKGDSVYGALPRYDVYIDHVNFPCRLCLNPPYTSNVIRICIEKTLAYMDRCRGEFIMFMPVMYNFAIQDRLFEYPHTRSCLVKGGTYVLYNFLNSTSITASMDLNVIVNVEGSGEASQAMLDSIISEMSEHSRSLASPAGSDRSPRN